MKASHPSIPLVAVSRALAKSKSAWVEPTGSSRFPPAWILWYHTFMPKQIVQPQKRRGPPPTGKGEPVQVRLQPNQMAALDNWISVQDAPLTRPQAIRRLVEQALASASPRPRPKAEAAKASALAQRELEQMKVDDAAPAEEQERRKRRLLKGPKEFRDVLGGGQQRGKSKRREPLSSSSSPTSDSADD